MSHLLTLAFGPVQDFIARARRTRDLWFGSHLLSELGRAAAKSLAEHDWQLVFPALSRGDLDLDPCDERWRTCTMAGRHERRPPLAVVNKIVAVGVGDPESAVADARAAMLRRWRALWNLAQGRAGALLIAGLTPDKGSEALDDALELYAGWCGWCPIGADSPYADARRLIDQELAARKHLREFTQWQGSALPKSSLDGFRETVLIRTRDRDDAAKRAARLGRLGDTEQLDGIGFVKRFGGKPDQFTSIARIAVQAWVDVVPKERLKTLAAACAGAGLSRFDPRQERLAAFPLDGEAFFRDRWTALAAELDDPGRFPKEELTAFLKTFGDPNPYVACIVADGDRMGAALSQSSLDTPEKHREISGQLAEFARRAQEKLDEQGGVAVYTGGDDVLGFVPVPTALVAAEALAASFFDLMKQVVSEGTPTLSVGVGIAHILSPMGELLDLGRRAEKLAKGDSLPVGQQRNALGILLSKRGGGESMWRSPWSDGAAASPRTARQKVEEIQKALSTGRLPRGFSYELEQLILRRLPSPLDDDFKDLLRSEIARAWAQKKPAGESSAAPPGLDPATATRRAVEEWIALAAIAKHFAEHDKAVKRAREAS